MPYAPFDVILLSFPFSERRGAKQRPGVVLSPEDFNAAHGHALVAMVTTARNTSWPSDLPIADYGAAGLVTPCVVRAKLVTVADDLVIGRVGTLAVRDAEAARQWARGLIVA